MVNTELLNQKIVESGKTRRFLAEQCGITVQSLRLKIKNQLDFKIPEVQVLCEELSITSLKEKESIFFANHVAKNGNK